MALGSAICYTITERNPAETDIPRMAAHHRHHHPAGHAHPPAALTFSILRLSALQRLAGAAALAALIWAAVYWAMA